MKKAFRLALGLTIVALTLLAIPGVLALSQPIGTSTQAMPFESKPSAVEAGSRVITTPANAYDGDPVVTFAATTYGGLTTVPARWGVQTFSRPSDAGLTDFDIASVTMHIQYAAPALAVDDKYRLVYYVGAAGPFALQDWTGSPTTASSTNFPVALPSTTASGGTQLSRSWGEISDLGDGTWTWDEIASVRVRVEFQLVSTTDARPFRIYEIWLTAYDQAPPAASPTVSIQPSAIANMPAEDFTGIGVFFVDIYAHSMVFGTNGLQAVEFTIEWDPTILQVWDPDFLGTGTWGTYWPWTAENWWTLDNGIGQVSVSLIIPTANVLVDYGLQGSFPVLRIWFAVVDPTMTGISPIHFRVSTMVAPGGNYIPSTAYDGHYGGAVPEFPFGPGIVLILAPLVALGYVWRTRRKVTK